MDFVNNLRDKIPPKVQYLNSTKSGVLPLLLDCPGSATFLIIDSTTLLLSDKLSTGQNSHAEKGREMRLFDCHRLIFARQMANSMAKYKKKVDLNTVRARRVPRPGFVQLPMSFWQLLMS